MSKGFVIVLVAICALFVGIVAFTGGDDKENSVISNAKPSQHIYSKTDSKVTLVEYGDFQCPYCYQYEPIVAQVREKYKGKINFQFRNFPLQATHQNAFAAHRAAEAAKKKNKFWEMHDLLYQNQKQWSEAQSVNPYFESYAKQIGLDVNKYKTDFASKEVNAIINADMKAGNDLKVTGTPTFFLNGKKTEITADLASFEKVIDAAIQKQGQ